MARPNESVEPSLLSLLTCVVTKDGKVSGGAVCPWYRREYSGSAEGGGIILKGITRSPEVLRCAGWVAFKGKVKELETKTRQGVLDKPMVTEIVTVAVVMLVYPENSPYVRSADTRKGKVDLYLGPTGVT